MRKYEFTGETQNIECTGKVITLRRIRAARDFMGVKKEELGGWIETEDNLSHSGNAWVSGDAQVSGNARLVQKQHIFAFALFQPSDSCSMNAPVNIRIQNGHADQAGIHPLRQRLRRVVINE